VLRRKSAATWLWLLLCLIPQTVVAERSSGMTKATYDRIAAVQQLFEEDQWATAIEKLQAITEGRVSNYERAHAFNMLGFAWYQLDNLERSMQAYRSALAQENIPVSQTRWLLTTISQVALMAEDYAAAERYAIELVELKYELPPEAASWVVLAQARIGQENYAGALSPMLKAIETDRDAGNQPREEWLLLLSSIYYMTDSFEAMREVLYELVALYPKEKYLINLAALHGELGDSRKQLALVEALLDDQRLQRSEHRLSLVNLFLANGLPYKAAALLQREIEAGRIEADKRNLELLSQAWYMAGERERSIPPLAQAAAISKEGDLHMRVARLYMDDYNWDSAEIAAQKAVEMSSGEQLGDALLLLGMAMANANKLEPAKRILKRAADHENVASWALQWLSFVETEQRRMDSLQAMH
jgi:tetratricopeptide (TPR) repeat protein